MWGQVLESFSPFILVCNRRSSHSNVSQTLVRARKARTPFRFFEIKGFDLAVSQGPIRFADTKSRRYVLAFWWMLKKDVHVGSVV